MPDQTSRNIKRDHIRCFLVEEVKKLLKYATFSTLAAITYSWSPAMLNVETYDSKHKEPHITIYPHINIK
jgi:hypothetical protein